MEEDFKIEKITPEDIEKKNEIKDDNYIKIIRSKIKELLRSISEIEKELQEMDPILEKEEYSELEKEKTKFENQLCDLSKKLEEKVSLITKEHLIKKNPN